MSLGRLHRGLSQALAHMSAPHRRTPHGLASSQGERSKLESTTTVGDGWGISHTARLDSHVATDWQRRLLVKRGAEIYTRSLDRADRCAIAVLDAQGVVIAWHDYLPNARAYDHRVVSRHMSQFYLPQDIALHLPAHHLSIALAHGADTQLGWRRRPSGEVFWGMTVIQTIMLKDGGLLGYSHVTRSLRSPATFLCTPARAMPPQAAGLAMA